MYWCKIFSIPSDRHCFSWPRVVRSRGCCSLLLGLTWIVGLVLLLSIVDHVALATPTCCLATAHTWHAHHSEVSSHAVIEKHPFEFSVRVETQNYCHNVVDSQHADDGKLKRGTCRTSVVNASDRAGLNAETNYIDEREEVDRDVDHVKSETTEVHLC